MHGTKIPSPVRRSRPPSYHLISNSLKIRKPEGLELGSSQEIECSRALAQASGGGRESWIRKHLGRPHGGAPRLPQKLDGARTVVVRVRSLNGRLLGILGEIGGPPTDGSRDSWRPIGRVRESGVILI